jgi:hypothetical protein
MAALAFVGAQANAATITWATATNMAGGDGTTDVLNEGTLLDSVNVNGSSAVTIDGVIFKTEANSSISVNGNGHNDFVFDPTDPALTSTDYLNGLDEARYSVNTIQITGLTSGQEYKVQVWANDARGSQNVALGRSLYLNYGDGSAASSGVQVLDNQNVGGTSTLGQWIVGTFTADAATETILATGYDGSQFGDEYGVVPLVQVREVPEPATLGMIGALGGLMLFIRRRFMI